MLLHACKWCHCLLLSLLFKEKTVGCHVGWGHGSSQSQVQWFEPLNSSLGEPPVAEHALNGNWLNNGELPQLKKNVLIWCLWTYYWYPARSFLEEEHATTGIIKITTQGNNKKQTHIWLTYWFEIIHRPSIIAHTCSSQLLFCPCCPQTPCLSGPLSSDGCSGAYGCQPAAWQLHEERGGGSCGRQAVFLRLLAWGGASCLPYTTVLLTPSERKPPVCT